MPKQTKKTQLNIPPLGDRGLIASMFDDIAPHYDFLNHFLSLNIDKWWRKKLVRKVAQHHPATILDVATGTGDLAIALHRRTRAAITAVDISEGMLNIAKRKTGSPLTPKGGTENGERRTENGERRTENGERKTENGERRTENGKRKTS